MSGHNPAHGRMGQPNSSWNPLQVPSYIPRQPQLAHIASSSESATRSPLAWHATHQEQLYNFMTANKNNLDINPLLPTYNRPPDISLGGSVDLSISAASRNTPSPKNPNPSMPRHKNLNNIAESYIHKDVSRPCFDDTPIFVNMLSNRSPPFVSASSPSSVITSSPSVIQSTAAVKEQAQQHLNNGKSDQNVPGGLYVKDAKQINNDYVGLPPMPESTETMKDLFMHAIQNNPNAISPRRNSPLRPPLHPNLSPNRSRSPPATIIQNTELPSAAVKNVPSLNENVPATKCEVPSSTQSPSPILNNNNASNDDSIDSSSSKRRKRKPNKTTRIENEPTAPPIVIEDDDFNNSLCDTLSTVTTATITAKSAPTPTLSAPEDSKDMEDGKKTEKITETPPAKEKTRKENIENGEKSDHEGEPLDMKMSEKSMEKVTNQPKSKKKPGKTSTTPPAAKKAKGGRKKKETKNDDDLDDVETIDKISAMISSTAQEENENKAENRSKPCNGLLDKIDISAMSGSEEKSESKSISSEIHGTPVDSAKFEEIENKLEEMFAEEPQEPDPGPAPNLISASKQSVPSPTTNEPINEESEKKERSPSPTPKKAIKKPATGKGNTALPKKRKRMIKKKQNPNAKNGKTTPASNKKNAKNTGKGRPSTPATSSNAKAKSKGEAAVTVETVKFKGPYVHVRPDGTQTIINAPLTEEAPEKAQNKGKKIGNHHHHHHHHNNAEKSKISGLHVSTLSMKYDADTTDKTWMCVFCKQGPHKSRLGDLFGPYFITTTSSEYEFSQEDPETDPFNVKRTKETMAAKHKIHSEPENSPSPKKKRKMDKNPQSTMEPVPCSSNSSISNGMPDIFYGMVKSGDSSYEVWVHEDCLTWAPGVYVVGTRVVGLEGAIWTCTRHLCSICSHYGAVINCLHKGCTKEAHVSCARSCHWTLDDEFKCKCELHKDTS